MGKDVTTVQEEAILPIREFSRLSGISRETLRFYDKIGLLSPAARRENDYRYYAGRQLELAFLISGLRALGMGLEEIKRYADCRSPEGMLALFREQNGHIEAEIERLRSIQGSMAMRAEAVARAMEQEEDTVKLEERERRPIFLCPLFKDGVVEADAMVEAYRYALDHGVNASYPFGGIVSKKGLKTGDWSPSSRYYFTVPKNHNAWKAAGTYAVYCRRLREGPGKEFYRPLLTFLEKNELRMEGDAYEEYLLDELSTRNKEDYLIRVEVRVV